MTRRPFLSSLLLAVALLAGACGDDGGGAGDAAGDPPADAPATLTVYSGRSEELVGPLVEQFEADSGIDVEVRYGDTAQMAGAILEEGDNSPADVYYGQDAGALGALSSAGRLQSLDAALLERVDPQFRSVDGRWVGVSGRARVAVYNTNLLSEEDLPESILDFSDPRWGGGKIGWAPTNGSFQAFVTALRVAEGEDVARAWLEGIRANEPKVYDANVPIVDAAGAGEIQVGFVNHYYLYRALAEDPNLPAANHIFPNGDLGSLVNVAGVGIVDTAEHTEEARRFVEFLLGEPAQQYFAAETFEIPLVAGIESQVPLPPLESLQQPDINLNELADLQGTLDLMAEVGVI
ncbi:MAG: iron ABC transporter substrate-binding protein [Actinomycetota bacterium]|nr:iron ABC transporter substrate-binding protein [Actinomycetota bacterium]